MHYVFTYTSKGCVQNRTHSKLLKKRMFCNESISNLHEEQCTVPYHRAY